MTVGRFKTVVPLCCDKAVLPGDDFSYASIFTSFVQDMAVMHAALPTQLP